jgi:hypothetical protein
MDTNLKYYRYKLYIALYIQNDHVASSIEAQLAIMLLRAILRPTVRHWWVGCHPIRPRISHHIVLVLLLLYHGLAQ